MSTDATDDERRVIRFNVPERFYLLPGAAIIVGTVVGLVRGSRAAGLRFLAENAHRAPTTVKGWYFYNKTKNYRVMMGGLREAGLEAARLGTVTAGWVALEEGCQRFGLEEAQEVVAGVGTAGVFSLVYRLPWRAARRTIGLGLVVGLGLRGLRWGRDVLEADKAKRRLDGERRLTVE